jgi:hypothetical protein
MLQAGAADPDFLLYWPVYDVWQQPEGLEMKFTVHSRAWLDEQPFGRFARELYGRGWSFDFVSDRLLAQVSAAADGALCTPGARYAAILIPACQRMPVETMARLLSLADSGATVVFDSALPEDVPGLGHLESRRAALRKLTGSLAFRDTPAGGVRVAPRGAGRILLGPAEAALAHAGLRRETLTGHPGLEFLRRVQGDARAYFLANRGRHTVDGWTPLARSGRQAILMDPLTGETGEAACGGARTAEQRCICCSNQENPCSCGCGRTARRVCVPGATAGRASGKSGCAERGRSSSWRAGRNCRLPPAWRIPRSGPNSPGRPVSVSAGPRATRSSSTHRPANGSSIWARCARVRACV